MNENSDLFGKEVVFLLVGEPFAKSREYIAKLADPIVNRGTFVRSNDGRFHVSHDGIVAPARIVRVSFALLSVATSVIRNCGKRKSGLEIDLDQFDLPLVQLAL